MTGQASQVLAHLGTQAAEVPAVLRQGVHRSPLPLTPASVSQVQAALACIYHPIDNLLVRQVRRHSLHTAVSP